MPDEVKSRIGLVSTSAGLYQWLTPREMLLFFADLYNVPPRKSRPKTWQRLADLFGLSDFLDRRCATLSTGQKQRVNLARSLIHDPPVLLLDEPTRGLDVLGSKVIFDYIAAARDGRQGRDRLHAPARRSRADVRPLWPAAPRPADARRNARRAAGRDRPDRAHRHVPAGAAPEQDGHEVAAA